MPIVRRIKDGDNEPMLEEKPIYEPNVSLPMTPEEEEELNERLDIPYLEIKVAGYSHNVKGVGDLIPFLKQSSSWWAYTLFKYVTHHFKGELKKLKDLQSIKVIQNGTQIMHFKYKVGNDGIFQFKEKEFNLYKLKN